MSLVPSLSLSPLPVATAPSQRRVGMRVAAIMPVELILSSAGGGALPAMSVDIGLAGVCVQTTSIIDPRTIRAIRLNLGDRRIELAVRPRWNSALLSSDGPLTGLIFEAVDSCTQAALWDFVQQRACELGEFLGGCAGLDQLPFEETLDLALTTRLRQLKSGDLVYGTVNQKSSESIFVLMRGSISLEPARGRRHQEISAVKPRELFGGLPIIAGCESFERAVALEDCKVLEFVGYNVEYLLAAKPGLGVSLLRAASFHWMRRFVETLDRTMTA